MKAYINFVLNQKASKSWYGWKYKSVRKFRKQLRKVGKRFYKLFRRKW